MTKFYNVKNGTGAGIDFHKLTIPANEAVIIPATELSVVITSSVITKTQANSAVWHSGSGAGAASAMVAVPAGLTVNLVDVGKTGILNTIV